MTERPEQPTTARQERGDPAMNAHVGATVIAMERMLRAQHGQGAVVGFSHLLSVSDGCVRTSRSIVKKPCNPFGARCTVPPTASLQRDWHCPAPTKLGHGSPPSSCRRRRQPQHALGLRAFSLQFGNQLRLGRQEAAVGRRDDLIVVFG